MKQKNDGITQIKYGELHKFYPLKMDSSLSFNDLCDTIRNSSIIFKTEYQEAILHALGKDTEKIVQELNDEFKDDSFFFKLHDFPEQTSSCFIDKNVNKQDLRIELHETGSSLLISLVNTELEALQNRIKRIQQEYEFSTRIYGKAYVNSQERFLLLPLKVKLYNQESTWIYPVLHVFSNNMAILKLELPLINVSTEPLKLNDIDGYINETYCTWDANFSKPTSFDSIKGFYFNKLAECTKIIFLSYNDTFRHIIIVDFNGVPPHINNLSDSLQEDIFRIISAPVPDLPTSYRKDALEHFKNYSWGNHNIKCVIKTTGGCLSFCDKALLEYCSNLYKKNTGITILDDVDHLFMCNYIARDIQNNTEFALIIIMLKKINQHNDYFQKRIAQKKLFQIKKEYYKNVMYIADLQESCYGSVSDQIDFFEKSMHHYTKTEITNSKLNALNQLLSDEETKKQKLFKTLYH